MSPLSPLIVSGEGEITAMIDRVTSNKALPENIRQDIIERGLTVSLCSWRK